MLDLLHATLLIYFSYLHPAAQLSNPMPCDTSITDQEPDLGTPSPFASPHPRHRPPSYPSTHWYTQFLSVSKDHTTATFALQ
jgi:hypothetical protein